jgi:acetyl esterase/lipase
LFLHGGGYIFTAAPPHWNSLADLASRFGIAVTAPLYPLAPESGVVETTDWALDYYRHYAEQTASGFVLGGDSAGGGLAAATAMAARDAGLRLPAGLLLICPWLDVAGDHPQQPEIERRDCILRLSGIRDAGRLYRRDVAADDWRVSPIHGDWSGLPPIQMFGGGDDILVTDARTLKARVPAIDYDERAGLMHDWPLFFFSESKAARAKMAQWIVALT